MNRTIDRWKICSPTAMCTQQSQVAQIYAMEDARHDIIELHDQNKRLRSLLKIAAYPRRGTEEERMDIQEFADIVQATYTCDQLDAP